MNKPHLSPTQINMFLRCSAQYFFRYIEGIKAPPGIALTLGKSIDEALNLNYQQKKDTFEDLKVEPMIDIYETTYDREIKNTIIFPSDDLKKIREEGIGLIKQYHTEISPVIQPIEVQEKIEIPFNDFDYDLVVVPDLITIEEVIVDNKTVSKSPPQDNGKFLPMSFEHKLQMIADSFAFGVKYQKSEKELRLDYLVKTKTPQIKTACFGATKADHILFLNLLSRVADAIENNVFLPNRNCQTCSHKFCGYAKICESYFGGKVKEV